MPKVNDNQEMVMGTAAATTFIPLIFPRALRVAGIYQCSAEVKNGDIVFRGKGTFILGASVINQLVQKKRYAEIDEEIVKACQEVGRDVITIPKSTLIEILKSLDGQKRKIQELLK